MNDYLTSKLMVALNKAGKTKIEFKELPENLSIEEINFHGVRDHRLVNKNVITPKDTKALKDKAVKLIFWKS